MIETLEEFISKTENFDTLSASSKCDYFIYFLTEFKGMNGVRPKDVEDCFTELKIQKYSNVAQYLTTNSKRIKSKAAKFIKQKDLYHLERKCKEEIKTKIHIDKPFIETNKTLRSLLPKLKNKSEQDFLIDAIKSFEVEAFRSSIVMVWLLTIDHLYEYILVNKLTDFNTELAKVTDKRVKATIINSKDDFSDIPEGKFIELCRASKIISNDVRKILEEKLGTRNSAAHPSNINIGRGKTFDFIEDLINNVISKY